MDLNNFNELTSRLLRLQVGNAGHSLAHDAMTALQTMLKEHDELLVKIEAHKRIAANLRDDLRATREELSIGSCPTNPTEVMSEYLIADTVRP